MDRFTLEDVLVIRDGGIALEVDRLGLPEGAVTALTGPNGSGKTTLLLALTGLLTPHRGRLLCRGTDLGAFSPRDLEAHRKTNHLLFQDPFLFSRSVEWNVGHGLALQGVKGAGLAQRVEAALDAVGLAGQGKRSARRLSGGEAQRVALARALALEPGALLLDEPLANIDAASRSVIERVLMDENRHRKTTVIFTTHDLDQARRLADTVITLHGGRVVEGGMENTFHGKAVTEAGTRYYDTGRLRIALPISAPDARTACIPPEAIIVSLSGQISGSARNCLEGVITSIQERNGSVDVVADVGEPLVARITRGSYERMGLALGQRVWLVFKAASVRLY